MITPYQKQRGAVLILSLIILIAFTSLGVAILSGAAIEKKVGRNFNQLEASEQAALSVLNEGRGWLENLVVKPVPTATGILRAKGSIHAALSDPVWWTTNGISSTEMYVAGANAAKYIIEEFDLDETLHEQLYRVIAIGYAQNSNIYKITQQIYRIPFARVRYHGDHATWIYQGNVLACQSQNAWSILNTCELMNVTKDSSILFSVNKSSTSPVYGLLATIQWQGKTYKSNAKTFTPVENTYTLDEAENLWDNQLVNDYLLNAQWLWGTSTWFNSVWQPGKYHVAPTSTGGSEEEEGELDD